MKTYVRSPRMLAALLFTLAAAGFCGAAIYNSSFNSAPITAPTLEQQFETAVAELQQNPASRNLREQIIKLAQIVTPELPEEARQHFDRALTLSQKDDGQKRMAAAEYKQALRIAPWWPEPYYELGVVSGILGGSTCAAHSFELYLLAAPEGLHGAAAQEKLRIIESRMLVKPHADCIECGQTCTKYGTPCCGTCECTGGKFPNTYCEESW